MKTNILFAFCLFLFSSCSAMAVKEVCLFDVNFVDGQIDVARLAQDTAISVGENVIIFLKGSPIYFGSNGNINSGYLKSDQIITLKNCQIKIKAVGFLGGIGDYDISFHQNGVPRIFWLAEDTRIILGGHEYVFMAARTIMPLVLDGEGSQGRAYREYVEFYNKGEVYSGFISEDISIGDSLIVGGTQVIFDPAGEIIKYWDDKNDEYIDL